MTSFPSSVWHIDSCCSSFLPRSHAELPLMREWGDGCPAEECCRTAFLTRQMSEASPTKVCKGTFQLEGRAIVKPGKGLTSLARTGLLVALFTSMCSACGEELGMYWKLGVYWKANFVFSVSLNICFLLFLLFLHYMF